MKLSIKMLNSSSTVNNLMYINELRLFPGDTATIMFQLVDSDIKLKNNDYLRYMPASGAAVNLTINSINSLNILNLTCAQPFPNDLSVWSVNLNQAQSKIIGSTGVTITLTEGASVKSANVSQVIIVDPSNMYGC